MKTAVINVKVDEQVKKQAQVIASSFGIPLSTLVNAYLTELAITGQIHFSAIEIMTPKMEKLIEQAEKEIKAGDTSGPFNTAEEAIAYLKSL
jgi:addiction module RelB/DinJ family antitoxin